MDHICENCEVSFTAPASVVGRFCSRPCKYEWDKSRPRKPLPESKQCSICREIKPSRDFHLGTSRTGQVFLQGRCKTCCRTYLRQWSRSENGKALKKKWGRTRNLSSYGITKEQYDAILLSQGGVCAICRTKATTDSSGRALSVDHNHETGAVRGLLCHPCNVAIGLMKENVGALRKAILYVSRSPKSVSL